MTDSTRAKAPPILVSYSKVLVSVIEGPDTGRSREVIHSTLRIGTSSDNDLVLNDETVSRHHCAIQPMQNGIRIHDEGSRNGVFMGSLRVLDIVATNSVEILLGHTKLRVEPLAERVSREQLVADRFGDLLGSSTLMRELFADLERIARSDVTLLIEGETGTGKELVAESVHRASKRAEGPFITLDCSALAPTLIESELYGTTKSGFTDAKDRPGVFEQAHHGTIFLDELGELPKELQPKLLRALESRQVRRIGGTSSKSFDVRVIAATNRNLSAEVERGNFREDLYYRLSTAQVRIPPLRDRMDDLPMLVEHFLERARADSRLADIPAQVWNMFEEHRWPGNVRELWNAVQRLLVTPDRVFPQREASAAGTAIRRGALSALADLPPLQSARREAADAFEYEYIRELMERASGNIRKAAVVARVTRQNIESILRKHGLSPGSRGSRDETG